jgi:hypothetical protein
LAENRQVINKSQYVGIGIDASRYEESGFTELIDIPSANVGDDVRIKIPE